MWNRLVSKYAPHTASSLLKLNSEFHNSKLESIEKDPNEWILNLERLRISLSEFGLKCKITDEDFMIDILNILSKQYDVILDGLENRLTASEDNALTIEVIGEKLNQQYKNIKNKDEEKGLRSL